MVRNKEGKILIVDNDVMVYIFHDLFTSNRDFAMRVIQYLSLKYSRMWIPKEIRNEFLLKRKDKRRLKIMDKICEAYPIISACPIKVAKHEIKIFVGIGDDNRGEADAILQSIKAKTKDNLFFEDIVFLSNDRNALLLARRNSVATLPYGTLRVNLREVGITF